MWSCVCSQFYGKAGRPRPFYCLDIFVVDEILRLFVYFVMSECYSLGVVVGVFRF